MHFSMYCNREPFNMEKINPKKNRHKHTTQIQSERIMSSCVFYSKYIRNKMAKKEKESSIIL